MLLDAMKLMEELNSAGAAFFEENATGKLSFLSNVVGIYKDVTDKEGNGTFTMWELK